MLFSTYQSEKTCSDTNGIDASEEGERVNRLRRGEGINGLRVNAVFSAGGFNRRARA
jgi:hypothetical protein